MTRPTGVFKIHNEYASATGMYESTPKAVYAALAYSLAQRLAGDDNPETARKMLRDEWDILNAQGIIPQTRRAV